MCRLTFLPPSRLALGASDQLRTWREVDGVASHRNLESSEGQLTLQCSLCGEIRLRLGSALFLPRGGQAAYLSILLEVLSWHAWVFPTIKLCVRHLRAFWKASGGTGTGQLRGVSSPARGVAPPHVPSLDPVTDAG